MKHTHLLEWAKAVVENVRWRNLPRGRERIPTALRRGAWFEVGSEYDISDAGERQYRVVQYINNALVRLLHKRLPGYTVQLVPGGFKVLRGKKELHGFVRGGALVPHTHLLRRVPSDIDVDTDFRVGPIRPEVGAYFWADKGGPKNPYHGLNFKRVLSKYGTVKVSGRIVVLEPSFQTRTSQAKSIKERILKTALMVITFVKFLEAHTPKKKPRRSLDHLAPIDF